ncbi:hypothetical protein AFLA70_464g000761, partial [Aspergillus flavus AF70]
MYLSCQRARAEIYSVSLTLSAFVKAAAARIGNPHPAKWKEGKLSGPPAGCVSMVLEFASHMGNDNATCGESNGETNPVHPACRPSRVRVRMQINLQIK